MSVTYLLHENTLGLLQLFCSGVSAFYAEGALVESFFEDGSSRENFANFV